MLIDSSPAAFHPACALSVRMTDMETYYDIGSGDLKEFWDSDLDPAMQEALENEEDMPEWFPSEAKSTVVLHDRLMTDAALGAPTVKTEHSYSLSSDVDSAPTSPNGMHTKVDDMEDECYPAIPLRNAWNRKREMPSPCSSPSPSPSAPPIKEEPPVKQEPLSRPSSPSCSVSPSPSPSQSPSYHDGEELQTIDYVIDHTTGSIHLPQSALRRSTQLLLGNSALSQLPKLSIKVEPNSSGFGLPPTPPSSLSSEDSEGALSPARAAPSPPPTSRRVTPSHHLYQHARQPIHTPLISSQPKGSVGTLVLTEEEKRTLMAEGYPVPTRLPLTKSEEKSLKKIRRKIKNKISAQESRRKKKEYMDQLEKKVESLLDENSSFRKRVETLEQSNASLLSQLNALRSAVAHANRK